MVSRPGPSINRRELLASTAGDDFAGACSTGDRVTRLRHRLFRRYVMRRLRVEHATMERRGHERSRVVGIGRIDTGSSYLTSCIIRDLTVSGARLMVSDADALPERFQLVFQATGHTTSVRVVWRGEGVCGVEFAPGP
jgi:hypothetical protein